MTAPFWSGRGQRRPPALLRQAGAALALAVTVLGGPQSAAASDAVEAAERAYKDVDFEAQLAQASRALEEGHHDPATLANIYRLLGIAHAALNAPEAAKGAFMRLLAIDRDIELEHVLSPRLRTPYMEARGFWDVSRSRLDLALEPADGGLVLSLSDPLGMARRVRMTTLGGEPVQVADRAAAPRIVVEAGALAPHARRALQVELLDARENVLLARVLSPPAAPAPRATPAAPQRSPRKAALPPTLSLALGGSALLALGVGVTGHLVRESKASEWNGTECEQVGRGSRADQCGRVDEQRRSAQAIALAGYAAGGALLAASVVSYLVATDAEPEPEPGHPRLACGASALGWGLRCAAIW